VSVFADYVMPVPYKTQMALVNSRRYSVRNLQRQGDVLVVDFTARGMPAYNAAVSELCRFKTLYSCGKFSWHSWNSPFPSF